MLPSQQTFIWMIPRFTDNEIDYICHGYIRTQSNNFVPNDIINLCKNYYKNDFKLNGSLSPKQTAHFKSGMFEYKGIKFYMTFDKGISKDTLFDTESEWNIIIPYLPKNISAIDINCRNTVKYKNKPKIIDDSNSIQNKKKSTLHHITHKNLAIQYLKYDKICSKTFSIPTNPDEEAQKEMKIKSTFALTDMRHGIYSFHMIINDFKKYDLKKQIIDDNKDKNKDEKMLENDSKIAEPMDPIVYLSENLCDSSGGHIWHIYGDELDYMKKAEPGSYFVSSLFNVEQFKWMMKLSYYDDISYGSSADFCLYLTSLSNKIKQLNIRYKLWFVELNKSIDAVFMFKTNNRSLWKLDLFHVDDIKKMDKLTINIEMLILDVFYEHKDDKKNIIHAMNPCLKTLNGMFEWRIIDADLVNKIKKVKTGVDFESEIFELGQFKWYLKFYPNGYSANYSGSTDLFLRLASIPPNIAHISANYQLMLDEKNTKHFTVSQFSSKSASFGWNKLKNTDIQNINTFTFRAVIKIIDVFDTDGNNITNQFIDIKDFIDEKCDNIPEMPLVKFVGNMPNYIWRIDNKNLLYKMKNALNGEQFESEIFRMGRLKWMIKVFSNGEAEADVGNGDMLIYLVSLSPKLKGICVFYKISLLELGVMKNSTVGLTHSRMKWWTENMWKLQDIQNLESLTFELNVNILDIFDKNGHNINHEYDNIFVDKPIDNNHDMKGDIQMCKKYKWEVTDIDKVKWLKESPQTVSFKSGYYKLNAVKLFMQFLPNNEVKDVGEDNKDEDIDMNTRKYCSFGFTLCSIPPNIFSLTLKFELRLYEMNKIFTNIDQFSNEYNIVNWNLNPKLLKSEIMNLETFSFEAVISVIAVYDKDGNNITNEFNSYNNNDNDNDEKDILNNNNNGYENEISIN
eukprot:97185_1